MVAAPVSKRAPSTGPISQAQAREQGAWTVMTLPILKIPVRPSRTTRNARAGFPAELTRQRSVRALKYADEVIQYRSYLLRCVTTHWRAFCCSHHHFSD